MKKLLSLLSIITLAMSVPAPLLANTTSERWKRNVSTSNSNNDYVPLKEINIFDGIDNISSIAFDNQNNVYFGASSGVYKLLAGSNIPNKINGINSRVYSIAIDKQNNIFLGTKHGALVLKSREKIPTKINGINSRVYSITIDKQNSIYFGSHKVVYRLSDGSDIPTLIDGINGFVTSCVIDNNDNIYFGASSGAYKLSAGSETATAISSIWKYVSSIAIDKQNNIYFGTNKGAYKLSAESETATAISNISEDVLSIVIDNKENIYFGTNKGAYKLLAGSNIPNKIKGISEYVSSIAIDNNNNVYFGGDGWVNFTTTVLDWVKQQSQFNLVDSSKTKIWTRPDLVVVDGELNIAITNPNIDKVVFDNVLQGQTNKQWKINVKPETSEKDHHLQVFFNLDGKQYTSEIMVSMLAKIEPTTTPIKKQLSTLIKRPDLGNIIDNNDDTIFLAANKTNNNIIDDFTQLKIATKTDTEATLIAKADSKSYGGSVVVKYNVVPTTIVDSKIDLQSTTSDANVDSDYLAQLDKSNITNPVNTFYYASSESTITMIKPTLSSVINGVVYGCDDKWEKNGQQENIDITKGIKLDGSQLGAVRGKYLIELKNELGHINNIYLQIAADKEIKKYWNTDNGKNFEQWAEDNGYKNIRGSSADQLNNLFLLSKTWKQSLKHLKLQLDNFVVDDIKNVTQDEINTYKTKLLNTVKSQVEKYVPDVAENTDYKILADNLVADDWTTSKDVIVQAVDGSPKFLSFTAAIIPIQAKDHIGPPGPNTEQMPAPDNKVEDSKLWIIGVVVGVLAGVGTAYLLFKRFVFNKYILPKIYARRQQKVVEQWKRDAREEAEELERKQVEREQKQNKQNDNNKDIGGDE